MRNKRWDFICSYTGIMVSGLTVYVILLGVYLALRAAGGTADIAGLLPDFPVVFLEWTFPVIVIQTFFLLISDIILIIHERFGIRRLLGFAAGVVCAILNLLCRHFLFTAVLMCYVECVMIGIGLMSLLAVCHRPALDNDYLIILGCSIGPNGELKPLIKNRVNRAIRFAWEQEIATGKSVCYVPSGGQGSDEVISEGDAMSMYLISHSAESYEIMAEMDSMNTYENLANSKKLIDEKNPHAKITYVTTNFHVLRSGMLARRVGLNAEGLASPSRWYFWPNGFVREMAAIVVLYKKAQIAAIAVCAILTLLMCFLAR